MCSFFNILCSFFPFCHAGQQCRTFFFFFTPLLFTFIFIFIFILFSSQVCSLNIFSDPCPPHHTKATLLLVFSRRPFLDLFLTKISSPLLFFSPSLYSLSIHKGVFDLTNRFFFFFFFLLFSLSLSCSCSFSLRKNPCNSLVNKTSSK